MAAISERIGNNKGFPFYTHNKPFKKDAPDVAPFNFNVMCKKVKNPLVALKTEQIEKNQVI